MKKIITLFVLSALFFSCHSFLQVDKRKYRKGYHVQLFKKASKPKAAAEPPLVLMQPKAAKLQVQEEVVPSPNLTDQVEKTKKEIKKRNDEQAALIMLAEEQPTITKKKQEPLPVNGDGWIGFISSLLAVTVAGIFATNMTSKGGVLPKIRNRIREVLSYDGELHMGLGTILIFGTIFLTGLGLYFLADGTAGGALVVLGALFVLTWSIIALVYGRRYEKGKASYKGNLHKIIGLFIMAVGGFLAVLMIIVAAVFLLDEIILIPIFISLLGALLGFLIFRRGVKWRRQYRAVHETEGEATE